MARIQAFLSIIAWNVYIGSAVKDVKSALIGWIRDYRPEIFALMEASKLYGQLDHMGYEVIQLKPRPLGKGHQPAQGDVALMIHKSIRIKGRFAIRLKRFWKGPKHGWIQDPKVYRWVKIKWRGRTWKVGVAHSPFGHEARVESNNALVKWLKRTLRFRPTIMLLDANMLQAELEKLVAEPGGAEVDGVHIDLIMYKNCELVHERNLGKKMSDHPAMMYQMTA